MNLGLSCSIPGAVAAAAAGVDTPLTLLEVDWLLLESLLFYTLTGLMMYGILGFCVLGDPLSGS